jgi:hypothetical protein
MLAYEEDDPETALLPQLLWGRVADRSALSNDPERAYTVWDPAGFHAFSADPDWEPLRDLEGEAAALGWELDARRQYKQRREALVRRAHCLTGTTGRGCRPRATSWYSLPSRSSSTLTRICAAPRPPDNSHSSRRAAGSDARGTVAIRASGRRHPTASPRSSRRVPCRFRRVRQAPKSTRAGENNADPRRAHRDAAEPRRVHVRPDRPGVRDRASPPARPVRPLRAAAPAARLTLLIATRHHVRR